jgi:succinate dehydrogenase / fumarate reductase cytochrome b subunit
MLLLLGWTWSFAFHLLNGIRHLLQDIGLGYAPAQFVRNGWIVTIGSFVLTALVWACVFAQRGGA